MRSVLYNDIKSNFKNAIILNVLILTVATILFLLVYKIIFVYFVIVSDNNPLHKEQSIELLKQNTADNIFLFNASLGNSEDIQNGIFYVSEKNKETVKRITRGVRFPVGVMLRTASISASVYAFESSLIEPFGFELYTNIVQGDMYRATSNEIVMGIELASNIGVKEGDSVSFLTRNSRGWLDTTLFVIRGIYQFETGYNNYNIYMDLETASNFIHLRPGGSAPYFESYHIEFDNLAKDINIDKIMSDFENTEIAMQSGITLKKVEIEDTAFLPLDTLQHGFIALLAIICISAICLISACNHLQIQKRIASGHRRLDTPSSKRSQLIQILILAFLGTMLAIGLLPFTIKLEFDTKYVLYSTLLVLLCSALSSLLTVFSRYKIQKN